MAGEGFEPSKAEPGDLQSVVVSSSNILKIEVDGLGLKGPDRPYVPVISLSKANELVSS